MAKQLLHLVFGGELKDPGGLEFADLDRLDIVGIYPNYQTAYQAWRGAAQEDCRRCSRPLLHRPPAPARPKNRRREGLGLHGARVALSWRRSTRGRSMKVALIQMNSQGDKARNLEQAYALIEQAVAEERPDLVALPEIWPLLSEDDAEKRAAAGRCPVARPGMLQELAAKHRIVLHGGSIIERNGEAIYNTTVVFDRDGRSLPAIASCTCSTS